MKKILLLLLIFVSGCTGVVAQQFDYGKIAPHPRLLLPAGGEEAIRKAPVGHCSPADHGTLRPDTYGTACGTYQRG